MPNKYNIYRSVLPLILIALLVLTSCGRKGENRTDKQLNGNELKSLVEKAVSGDRQANKLLSNIIDESFPVNRNFQRLVVDSIKINKENHYYYVLLQYDNPAFNRFAVYDKDYNLYVLDKSLNGSISVNYMEKDDMNFIRVVESFLTKDIINLKRISLYKLEPESVKLAFRSFHTYSEPTLFLAQEFEWIMRDTIITTLSIPSRVSGGTIRDTFVIDPKTNMYTSRINRFDMIVKSRVNSMEEGSLPVISDENSLRSSLK